MISWVTFWNLMAFWAHRSMVSRVGKSTVETVDSLVKCVLNAIENKAFVQAILCDLSWAFDYIYLKSKH